MVGPFTFSGSGPNGTHRESRMITSRLLLWRKIELSERGGEGRGSVGCDQFIISDDYSSHLMTTFLSVTYFCIEKFLIKLCLSIPIH